MFKASNSHFWALIVALYFLEYGVWQLAADELGAGILFIVMAIVWLGLGRMQYRKTHAKKAGKAPGGSRVED